MKMRKLLLSVALACASATALPAQGAGTVELGAFARYVDWDTSYELKNYVGAGARFGVFIARNFAIELQGSYVGPRSLRTPGPDKIDTWSARALLEYNIPVGPFGLILGAGGTYNNYNGAADLLACGPNQPPLVPCFGTTEDGESRGPLFGPSYGTDVDEFGAIGLVGLRIPFSHSFQLRVDGTYEYLPTPPNRLSLADYGDHWGVNAGFSLMLGGTAKDTDGDGVTDKKDTCPNTPLGTPVDLNGCPLDDDKDGVTNGSDLCPNTPAGEMVDASGCSNSQKDDDRDGVMNSMDKCPNTPAGTKVNATGCPEDSDGDGVNDAADRCPNTPKGEQVDGNGCGACQRDTDGDGVPDCNDKCPSTNPGNKVDQLGCRILGENGELVLTGVTFATGKATLTPNSRTILDGVAAELSRYLAEVPSLRVEVGGHTDNTGSLRTNQRLSAARAASVEKYLESKGIDASRLVSKGYGPDKPVADNKTKDGRAQNRRVSLIPLY
jgi:outer membrane protein OmpA-like peptidoglycan-associated protein